MREPREPGRELDAEIAEKVMGWRWRRGRGLKVLAAPDDNSWDDLRGNERLATDAYRDVPGYSTDIAAAWLVVEKLMDSVFGVNLNLNHESNYTCHVDAIRQEWTGSADTAPLAICRAAVAFAEAQS